jgi:gliding motility-associated-like protein
MKLVLTATLLFCFSSFVAGQTCTTPGQTPSTAFPVCGTSVFQQNTVPICVTHHLNVPGCSGGSNSADYQDKNPYWYKFTCYQPGTLGFLVSPIDQGDDYDWQLYDITGHNPDDVFTDNSLIVTGNWAGTYGNTGASSSGVGFIQCASDPNAKANSYSKMPNLIQGHTYLLLVSHFTDSQSGYNLSFSGGTAVITDSTKPNLKYAEPNCGGDIIRVKLNKKMKCSSIAANGSDFYITPGNIAAVSANAINCSNGFDTDSIELKLGSPLPPGIYDLNVKKGTDGNTVLDYCDNAIPETDRLTFTITVLQPTPMDSIETLQCKPQTLRLLFRKPILCSSVAADGSDFTITGSYPVTITSANGSCTSGSTTSKEIIVNLSQPLYNAGNFTLTLNKGLDGNTIVDECNQQTPASSLNFGVQDTVNADFTYQVNYGCSTDEVNFFHPGSNNVNSWQWNLDENKKSTLQNPQAYYKDFTSKNISLIVSNGFCSDSSSQTFTLDNFLKADFDTYEDVCPNEPTNFTGLAQGHITGYNWEFGDGTSSSEESPSHIYSAPNATASYVVKYTVTDSFGCENTAQKTIKVYSSCYLAVPNAFTPNGDGKNDFLHPLNAIKAEKLDFKVYDRWGQLMFQTKNWKNGWDGTYKGAPQPSGVFVWFLTFVDRDTKQSRQMKGTAALIR